MRPVPNEKYFRLPPRDAMIVARKVAKKDGYVDWETLREWTRGYELANAMLFGEQLSLMSE